MWFRWLRFDYRFVKKLGYLRFDYCFVKKLGYVETFKVNFMADFNSRSSLIGGILFVVTLYAIS